MLYNLGSHQPDEGPEDDKEEAETETQETNKLLLSPALGGEVKVDGERNDDPGPVQHQPGDRQGSPPLTAGTWEEWWCEGTQSY